MKICLINNLYRPYERGGSEKVVDFIYKGLKDKGYEVFLISGAPYLRRRTDERSSVYYLRSIFFNIAKFPLLFRVFWHIYNTFDAISVFKVWLILKKEKPDMVMTHNLKGISFLVPRLLRSMGIRHMHTLHDIQLLHPSGLMMHGKEHQTDSLPAKVYQAVCRFLFLYPDTVISPSRWLLREHISRGFFDGSKKFVLPNPSPEFADIKAPADKQDNKFVFLYVGQMEEHKGVLFLTKAFVNFWEPFWTSSAGKKKKLSIDLWMAGAGSKIGEAGKIAYGDKRIKILGGKAHSEIKELMQKADCLIVPSLCYENSPTVIYEAASQGLPVIASRIGGISELVEKTGGLLFAPGDEDDLSEKMKYVLENRRQLDRVIAKERRFNPYDYMDNLVNLF